MTGAELGLGVRAVEWIAARVGWWIPKLEFVFDPDDGRYVQRTLFMRDGIDRQATGIAVATFGIRTTLFRVGLRARGPKTVDDVHVELASVRPPIISMVPFPLKLAHGQSQPLTLHPGRHPGQFIEVASKADGSEEPITIQHHEAPIDLPPGPDDYHLTLVATGRDVPAAERTFVLSIAQDGTPQFRAL